MTIYQMIATVNFDIIAVQQYILPRERADETDLSAPANNLISIEQTILIPLKDQIFLMNQLDKLFSQLTGIN